MTCLHCDLPTKALGMCAKHYHRVRRHGDPKVTMPSTPTIDAGTLVRWVRCSRRPIAELLPDAADRRAFYRAARTGRITPHVADRIAVRALGEPLLSLYGGREVA